LEEPIEKIWHNDIMNKWRTLTPKGCVGCSAFDMCHGGCKALAEIRGQDPLIGKPIRRNKNHSPIELELFEKSRPVLACKMYSEEFGYALVRGQAILTVQPGAKTILDSLDGQMTLQEIYHARGQDVLDFIGYLYVQGMVTFLD
jgi:hypothetical protein